MLLELLGLWILIASPCINCFSTGIYQSLKQTNVKASFLKPVTNILVSAADSSLSHSNTMQTSPDNVQYDLWVVGAGTLGELVSTKWAQNNPGARVVAETQSERRHANFLKASCLPRLRKDRRESDFQTARNVVITLPPSSSPGSYTEELREACRLWAGPTAGGKIIFSSSTAVYGESIGLLSRINEDSALDGSTARSSRMIEAEREILQHDGGYVVRFVGLYTKERGAHSMYLQKLLQNQPETSPSSSSSIISPIEGNGDGVVGLVHYDDAAEAMISVLNTPKQELDTAGYKVFLACDDTPLSRQDIAAATLRMWEREQRLQRSGEAPLTLTGENSVASSRSSSSSSAVAEQQQYSDPRKLFTRYDGAEGKMCSNEAAKGVLKWRPKYPSFVKFCEEQ